MNPKVSVVMPVYNASAYLRQTMDSILRQTLEDIEIICVDDGSTDDSLQILTSCQKNDPRIVLIRQHNMYAGAARNNGMEAATGKYLIFLDADDFFAQTYLEEMYQKAEDTQADLVLCRCNAYDHANQKTMWLHSLTEEYLPNQEVFSGSDVSDHIFQFCMGWPWDKLFQTAFVRKHRLSFQKIRTAEDVKFVFPALALAKRITCIRKELVTHRIFNASSLQETLFYSWESTLKMYDALYDELKKRNLFPKMRRSFDNFLASNMQSVLLSLCQMEAYRKMYDALRKETIPRFHLAEQIKSYYYDSHVYEQMQKLQSLSPDEYLMDAFKSYQNCLVRADAEYQNLSQTLLAASHKHWRFPFCLLPFGADVILYGAGNVGQDFYEQLQSTNVCHLTAWVDANFTEYQKQGFSVSSVETIADKTFDFIIIAVLKESTAMEIQNILRKKGVPDRCLLWVDLLKESQKGTP